MSCPGLPRVGGHEDVPGVGAAIEGRTDRVNHIGVVGIDQDLSLGTSDVIRPDRDVALDPGAAVVIARRRYGRRPWRHRSTWSVFGSAGAIASAVIGAALFQPEKLKLPIFGKLIGVQMHPWSSRFVDRLVPTRSSIGSVGSRTRGGYVPPLSVAVVMPEVMVGPRNAAVDRLLEERGVGRLTRREGRDRDRASVVTSCYRRRSRRRRLPGARSRSGCR